MKNIFTYIKMILFTIKSRICCTKYYKIVNPDGHHGMVYTNGINIDKLSFSPFGSCEPGGIYFTSRNILEFLDFGTTIFRVKPIGLIYKETRPTIKCKAHALDMKYLGLTTDGHVIKKLIDCNRFTTNSILDGLYICTRKGAEYNETSKVLIDELLRRKFNGMKDVSYRVISDSSSCGNVELIKYTVSKLKIEFKNISGAHDALINACVKGNLELAKYCVENGVDTNKHDCHAFRLSCSTLNFNIAKYLVDNGCDISKMRKKFLVNSVKDGQVQTVMFLIDNYFGSTDDYLDALLAAICTERMDLISPIMSKIIPNTDIYVREILKSLATIGKTKLVNIAIDLFKVDSAQLDEYLRDCVMKGCPVNIIESLITFHGANMDDDVLSSLIYKAVERDKPQIISYLIDRGVDISRNGKNSFAQICLNLKTKSARRMAELFTSRGLDVTQDNNRYILYACQGGNTEMVKFLISKGANVRFKNDLPLRTACSNKKTALVKYLISIGCNPNKKGSDGKDCFHIAIDTGCKSLKRALRKIK